MTASGRLAPAGLRHHDWWRNRDGIRGMDAGAATIARQNVHPRVSVVIPALNEARNLPFVLSTIPAWVTEVLLVDGGSTDETVTVATRFRADIRIIRQPGVGKGDALRAGFQAASGDIVAMLDADGSMHGDELESFVRKLLSGYDFVKGSRFLPEGKSLDITAIRSTGNRALLSLVRRLFGVTYTDLCYGYAAFWRDVLPCLGLSDEPAQLGFEIETLLTIRAIRSGLQVAEVPSLEAARVHGRSRLSPARDGWRVLRTILRERAASSRGLYRAMPFAAAVDVTDLEVSVVICLHDPKRWNAVTAAVASVRGQGVPPHEIVIVVDHNPALLRRVQRHFPDLTVLANGHDRGISGARNTGIGAATGDVIAFLDDDAIAAEDWIEQLKRGYANPRIMAVGGTVEPLWAGQRPRWLPAEFDWVVGCTHRGMPGSDAIVRNLVGSNMSFRREVFEQVGGFRPELGRVGGNGTGCEETELCVRAALQWPQSIGYNPDARVQHSVHSDRMQWRYFRSRCVAEGRSKARVSRIVGTASATSSERAYVWRTIGPGILTEIGAALRGNRDALLRAAVMLGGLALTTYGYIVGQISDRRQRARIGAPEPSLKPIE